MGPQIKWISVGLKFMNKILIQMLLTYNTNTAYHILKPIIFVQKSDPFYLHFSKFIFNVHLFDKLHDRITYQEIYAHVLAINLN